MKKLIIAAIVLLMSTGARAESLLDQVYAGFVGRAKLSIESTTKGTLQPEFLVNYVEIGKLNGNYVAAIDSGALGEILPHDGHFSSVDWTTGGKLHLSTLIRSYVKLPPEWEFLGTIELDARASYNWTQRHPTYGIVASVPFK